jgi:hypothetical protein
MTVDTMIDPNFSPAMMIAGFMIAMDRLGVRDYRIREARPAVQEPFEFVQQPKYASLVASSLLKSISAAISTKVNRAAKYHDIWPLGVLLRHCSRGSAGVEGFDGSHGSAVHDLHPVQDHRNDTDGLC